jgi:hypothetical protein
MLNHFRNMLLHDTIDIQKKNFKTYWIPASAGMTRFLAVIPVKLVLVKTGNGNPEKSLMYFLKVA